MTEKSSGLSVVVNNNGHISFNADLTFAVEHQEEVDSVHVADVVYSVVLDAMKKQVGSARLHPGDFRLVMTGCVSDITNTKEKTDGTTDTTEADQPGVLQEEDTEAEAAGEASEEATEEATLGED